jgi:hypothetical protein
MKILCDRYPKGSFPGQQTDGRYFDETLYENLKILAKKITDDMTWLGIISSSTLEVGTGKTSFATQILEAYLDLVRQAHGIDNRLTMKNIVFKPNDLIERAFKVPKYSVVLVDEWEDATYWSQLGMSLRQFFRKCRQLNLFIIIIIPNFFQLPRQYAISRSIFFIDVKFEGEFERGYFDFYTFEKKRELYIRGKKNEDYKVVHPNFRGRFTKGYAVEEDEYRKAKLRDLAEEELTKDKLDPKKMRADLFYKVYSNLKGKVTMESLANAFGVSDRTASRWFNDRKHQEKPENELEKGIGDNYINNSNHNDDDFDEEEVETS